MIILMPSVFFGALTYAITNDLVWALVVGSGWAIIGLILFIIGAVAVDLTSEIKRRKRVKRKRAELQARRERYERERSNR